MRNRTHTTSRRYFESRKFQRLYNCLNASYDSLRDDYEVSNVELNWFVDWSRAQSGVLGARLTIAGFGGCIVTLMENAALENYLHDLPQEYSQATGKIARCWPCVAEVGARIVAD